MKAIQITVLAILGVIIILLSGLLIAGLLGYIDSDFSKFFGKSVLIFDETYDGSERHRYRYYECKCEDL